MHRLRIALVGCGQISDAHLQEIGKIDCARAVAVCDRYHDLAAQAAARWNVPGVYDDLEKMLAEMQPDVLHIATPPGTHLPIALQALAMGTHVYIEKPFAVDSADAIRIIDAARSAKRLVTVGHNLLFDPVWVDCRQFHRDGKLGQVVHVEATIGYNLAGPFGKLLSDPGHWVHPLPGGLFHNTITHGLYRITEFLHDEQPRIWATWFGEKDGKYLSELRVMLQGENVTGNLVFSSRMRPLLQIARVYGTKAAIEVDFEGQLLRHYSQISMPGALGKIQLPFRQWCEAGCSLRRNIGRFMRSDLQYFAGMKRLFSEFYQAISTNGEPPIAYSEIIRLTAIMDRIFELCKLQPGAKTRAASCALPHDYHSEVGI